MTEGFFCPVQPPEAVQELALVLDQLSWLLPPDCKDVGSALRFTVGEGGGGVPPELRGVIANCGLVTKLRELLFCR